MGATRVCKVCGAVYPFCYTVRHDNANRWQDVACCPEHGTEYFRRILASRQPAAAPAAPTPSESEPKEDDEEEDEEEEDEEE